jgi:hypothetical protein
MVRVGIREFKAHMGVYIARVKAGETIMLTDRGEELIEMKLRERPAEEASDEVLRDLVRLGIARWTGERPRIPVSPVPNRSGVQVSDLLLEDRE